MLPRPPIASGPVAAVASSSTSPPANRRRVTTERPRQNAARSPPSASPNRRQVAAAWSQPSPGPPLTSSYRGQALTLSLPGPEPPWPRSTSPFLNHLPRSASQHRRLAFCCGLVKPAVSATPPQATVLTALPLLRVAGVTSYPPPNSPAPPPSLAPTETPCCFRVTAPPERSVIATRPPWLSRFIADPSAPPAHQSRPTAEQNRRHGPLCQVAGASTSSSRVAVPRRRSTRHSFSRHWVIIVASAATTALPRVATSACKSLPPPWPARLRVTSTSRLYKPPQIGRAHV